MLSREPNDSSTMIPLRRLLASLALVCALAMGVVLAAGLSNGSASASDRESGSGKDGTLPGDNSGSSDGRENSGHSGGGDSGKGDDDSGSDDDSDKDDDDSGSGDGSSGGNDDLPPAYTDCTSAKTTQPFAGWGDVNLYVEVVNGGFEDGLTGWTAKGGSASVVDSDRGAVVEVERGTKLRSPEICFDETRPHARMFARILAGEDETGEVEVEVRYDRVKGGIKKLDVGSFDQGASSTTEWTPTPELKTALDGVRKHVQPDADGNRWFRFEFKVKGKATWQFDDLFVDPRRRS